MGLVAFRTMGGVGAALAEANGCLFLETSSKDNKGVMAAFQKLGARVLETQESAEAEKEEEKAKVTLQQKKAPSKGTCC